jgi:hypothetical protein
VTWDDTAACERSATEIVFEGPGGRFWAKKGL